MRNGSGSLCGWTLNQSHGGARLVVEEPVTEGETYELVESETHRSRPIRVVWVHDEAGGQIVGVQFLDTSGTIPPAEGLRSDSK